MPVNIIDGFKINTSLPIDDKITASNSTIRNAITYKYNGLIVIQLDNRVEYIWNESKYLLTGITSSSWDIVTSVTGEGVYNEAAKWMSSGIGLTNTSIISSPKYYGEVNQKVGIGGSPNESFQVNSSYLTFSNYYSPGFGTCSPPFVIHKSEHTIIGENWYYDIMAANDKVFDPNFSSGTIEFTDGFKFMGRTPSNSATMSDIFDISNNLHIKFNEIGFTPDVINGSIYYDSTIDKINVGENSVWRTISGFDVYSILLSQSGNLAPTEILLETTIGTGTWSYQSTGVYNLVIDNGFISAVDIGGFCGPYTSSSVFFGEKINSSLYQIRTFVSEGTTASNNKLNNTFIEIKFINTPTPDKITTTTTTTSTTTTTTTSGIT